MTTLESSARTPPMTRGEARTQFRPALKFRWPVQFEIVDDANPTRGARHDATTLGVGIGGAFIVTERSGPVGAGVRLWLSPPASLVPGTPRVLRLHGEIRWISTGDRADLPAGLGIRFRGMTGGDEVHLHGCFSASLKMV